ncbi:hypothetical protein ACIBTV_27835 [Micromonospora sp. NPDC049366]|uniref:hypothetical protein n=1 Tax=Micromonospora sp. NPDC049366 TaxID=3364271 RepID=UPI0037B349AD
MTGPESSPAADRQADADFGLGTGAARDDDQQPDEQGAQPDGPYDPEFFRL